MSSAGSKPQAEKKVSGLFRSRSRETYICLKLIEYTSIPLAICIMLYILSGYGMVSPIFGALGFTYRVSVTIHTLPLLRFATAVLSILHLYGGIVVLANRYIRDWRVREPIKLLTLAALSIILILVVLSEIWILSR